MSKQVASSVDSERTMGAPNADVASQPKVEQSAPAAASKGPAWKRHLLAEVSVPDSQWQLCAMCLNTGFTDAITFTATFIWPGFQTGNTVQLSIALARLFSPGNAEQAALKGFQYPDALALCSLLAFILGAMTVRLNPAWVPFKSRLFCAYSSLFQALLTLAAALTCLYAEQSSFAEDRGHPSWTNALGFITMFFVSAVMGAQGVLGTKLASPFATTVVLTSVYCNLAMEPPLFQVWRLVPSRDQKLLAVLSAFIGGLTSRAIVGQVGAANALFVSAGLRVVNALMWLMVREKKPPAVKMV